MSPALEGKSALQSGEYSGSDLVKVPLQEQLEACELLHCGCRFSYFAALKEYVPGGTELSSVGLHLSLEQLLLPWVLLLKHLAQWVELHEESWLGITGRGPKQGIRLA